MTAGKKLGLTFWLQYQMLATNLKTLTFFNSYGGKEILKHLYMCSLYVYKYIL